MNEKFFINAKVKQIDGDIKKAIKKAGITYPHHSLAFFKATYAKFEEPNGNKITLANSVKDDVKYLIGTQMNRDHERMGAIMGSIIDAYVTKNNEIEIVFTFAKNVYAKDYELALDLMKKNELTVSFELKVDNKDVESLVGGVRRLKKVDFDGVGLLFGIKPAYKNAYVLETAMRIIEDAFNQNDKKMIYASAKDITKKWTKIGELIETVLTQKESEISKKILKHEIQTGGDIMDKKAQDALLAKFKEAIIAELGEEAVKNWSDKEWEAELEKRASAEESTTKEEAEDVKAEDVEAEDVKAEDVEAEDVKAEDVEAEDVKAEDVEAEDVKAEDVKAEDVKAEDVEAEDVKAEKSVVERDTVVKETISYDDETNEEVIKVDSEKVVKRDGKEVVKEKINTEVTYSYAQVEAIKAEYDKELENKDKEISFLKENAQKVLEIRAELGDFIKDLTDEDLLDESKLENARLKKRVNELENKDTLTAKDESEEELKTGHEEVKKEEETADDRVASYLKNKYGK